MFSKMALKTKSYNYFLTTMIIKVVKEAINKILARAEITESTQWLSAKKKKVLLFSVKSALVSSFLTRSVLSTDR